MTEESTAQRRDTVQEQPEQAPPGWEKTQESLSASSGLSVLLVNGKQPPALVVSNNNSICQAFQSSRKHIQLCDPYCGNAHRRAVSTDAITYYRCHAGLHCFTMPVQIGMKDKLAVIGGRAFLTGADYRAMVDRVMAGDLQDLAANELFQNVIFTGREELDQLASRIAKATEDFSAEARGNSKATRPKQAEAPTPADEVQIELQRLRTELEQRALFTDSAQSFAERINSADPQKTYLAILKHLADLLKAERSSLLAFDEETNELMVEAAIGFPVALEDTPRIRPGEGIAGEVLRSGQPLLAKDMEGAGFAPAPPERRYETKSFISYPIIVAGRKIGVLNVADKIGGGAFDEIDLRLLEIIAPQMALAMDRAEWQEKASQFQLMSITDPLTGLLNRRYLEERLTEELNRSKRYNSETSFMMIDIDDFKHYNDRNGHQAGDLALQMTAQCLKSALRSADVASRYGGEEFCILLPQTPLKEASAIAERIRRRVERTRYPQGKLQPLGAVTVSIGLSAFSLTVDTAEKIIGTADSALYHAKGRGKNVVQYYVEPERSYRNVGKD